MNSHSLSLKPLDNDVRDRYKASLYPKTYWENLKFREQVIIKARDDVELQENLREMCRRDILFWFNVFCWTYNPRNAETGIPTHLPFVTYSFQDNYLTKDLEGTYKDQEDLITDKSRDMGASWMLLLWIQWHWLFDEDAFSALLGSRKEDYVDKKGVMDSLFEKLRYNLKRLPKWMYPEGFDNRIHDNFMRIQNPETGSMITGESTNANFSVSGRQSVMLLDEFAKVRDAEHIWMVTADTTNCRFVISTPDGIGNKFEEIRHSGKYRVKSLHWSLHPGKADCTDEYLERMIELGVARREDQANAPPGTYIGLDGKIRSPWYDDECKRRSPREVAQELDISYLGSGFNVFDLHLIKKRENILLDSDKQIKPKYIHKIDMNGDLMIFKSHVPGHRYIVIADPTKGTGTDYGAVTVQNLNTGEQVAGYKRREKGDKTAKVVYELGYMYPDPEGWPAYAVVENNVQLCVEELVKLGYPNDCIHYHRDVNEQPTSEPGFNTNGSNRDLVLGEFEKAVRDGDFVYYDPRLIMEMYGFIDDRGKWKARDGYEPNDDMILACAIGWYCKRYVLNRGYSVFDQYKRR